MQAYDAKDFACSGPKGDLRRPGFGLLFGRLSGETDARVTELRELRLQIAGHLAAWRPSCGCECWCKRNARTCWRFSLTLRLDAPGNFDFPDIRGEPSPGLVAARCRFGHLGINRWSVANVRVPYKPCRNKHPCCFIN